MVFIKVIGFVVFFGASMVLGCNQVSGINDYINEDNLDDVDGGENTDADASQKQQ